ncbi:MAG: radical SAM protein [Deltaproteobacteria bacterium]|nr:radical SAM protein [Deltaproteobacteria bacterium]
MARCRICRTSSRFISETLGLCVTCIRGKPQEALPLAMEAHRKTRTEFALPEVPPKDPGGKPCNLCVNECTMAEGQMGYCGLRKNIGGRLTGVTAKAGKLSWYHDPLPTNCVGNWVCAGGTGAGYPKFAVCDGPERGYRNLAVFFHACTFNCLFCQNWHFKEHTFSTKTRSVESLLADVDRRTSCICYFGGDPAAQLPYSLRASRLALEKNRDRILRICWETNGSMHPGFLDRMMDMAIETGGCIKFDLKAWDENLHRSLTGVSNRRTLENFRRAGEKITRRPAPPPLLAATLLIPGYIDEKEITSIAAFIASIDSDIPYSLLAFHPQFYLHDLPLPTKAYAQGCLSAAKQTGLRNVKIGNIQLLT